MPPKRKSRPSTRTTTPAASSPTAPAEPSPAAQPAPSPTPSPSHTAAEQNLLSSWTTPQETGLFKALIKYKPTGIHKHVRMLSIRSYLLSNGYIHPSAAHTRIGGLWLKLSTLYDLKALDQREDSVDEDLHPEYEGDEDGPEGDEDEDEDEDEEKQALRDLVDFRGHGGFELDDHGEEFAVLKWRKRFAEDDARARKRRRSSSPVLPELLDREVPVRFVPSFSVDEEGEHGDKIRVARGRGGRGARGGRDSLKRGRVQDSVAESEDSEGEEENEEEGDDEGEEEDEDEEGEGDDREENEEDEEEEEESEQQESSEEQEETTAPATRGRGGRGRGAAAGRGRGRAGRRRGR